MSRKKETFKYNATQYLVAMLKAYGIKYIVSSPGFQNAYFNAIVQDDSFFQCYSVVDERSAGYVASGIIYETNEPVAIACTGATSSRNYLSAMTEAYYKNLPIIALTFYNVTTNKYKLSPQYLDRSVTQNDVKRASIVLTQMKDKGDLSNDLVALNSVLSSAKYKHHPVHIEVPRFLKVDFSQKNRLPDNIWTTKVNFDIDDTIVQQLQNKKIALYIGSHEKFSKEETDLISNFVKSSSIPVFCDHISNYHGENKILVAPFAKIIDSIERPDILIDIGGISGEYSSSSIFKDTEIWRLAQNSDYTCRYGVAITQIFDMKEQDFFNKLSKYQCKNENYFETIKEEFEKFTLPDFPLSNPFICNELSKYIKKNSSLHLSILNSLRCMNFFNLDETIDVNCNVGGFGIDGALSTLVGQSLVDTNKTIYALVGDLAFFYDMNILGNRHIGNNIKIIIVNNNCGAEFRINPKLEDPLGEKTNILIAAGGHYKNGAKAWVESCGLHYMSAKNKEEFLSQIEDFCTKDFKQSVVFEVFVKDEDEKKAMDCIRNLNNDKLNEKKENKSLLQKIFDLKK